MQREPKSDNEKGNWTTVDTAFSPEFAWNIYLWMTNGEAAAAANIIQIPINIDDSSSGFFPHVWECQEIKKASWHLRETSPKSEL